MIASGRVQPCGDIFLTFLYRCSQAFAPLRLAHSPNSVDGLPVPRCDYTFQIPHYSALKRVGVTNGNPAASSSSMSCRRLLADQLRSAATIFSTGLPKIALPIVELVTYQNVPGIDMSRPARQFAIGFSTRSAQESRNLTNSSSGETDTKIIVCSAVKPHAIVRCVATANQQTGCSRCRITLIDAVQSIMTAAPIAIPLPVHLLDVSALPPSAADATS